MFHPDDSSSSSRWFIFFHKMIHRLQSDDYCCFKQTGVFCQLRDLGNLNISDQRICQTSSFQLVNVSLEGSSRYSRILHENVWSCPHTINFWHSVFWFYPIVVTNPKRQGRISGCVLLQDTWNSMRATRTHTSRILDSLLPPSASERGFERQMHLLAWWSRSVALR